MISLRRFAPLLALLLGGCAVPLELPADQPFARPAPSVTRSPERLDEDAFWAIVAEVRDRGRSDPDRMAATLDARFYDASDATLVAFQERLVAASRRLYTWRHWAAADLICSEFGLGLDADSFTAWRVWVISLGRETFERVVADADSLAEVPAPDAGCALLFETYGWAVSNLWWERHPEGLVTLPDENFLTEPAGTRLRGNRAVRADLPRLTKRMSPF